MPGVEIIREKFEIKHTYPLEVKVHHEITFRNLTNVKVNEISYESYPDLEIYDVEGRRLDVEMENGVIRLSEANAISPNSVKTFIFKYSKTNYGSKIKRKELFFDKYEAGFTLKQNTLYIIRIPKWQSIEEFYFTIEKGEQITVFPVRHEEGEELILIEVPENTEGACWYSFSLRSDVRRWLILGIFFGLLAILGSILTYLSINMTVSDKVSIITTLTLGTFALLVAMNSWFFEDDILASNSTKINKTYLALALLNMITATILLCMLIK
jgi:hypothetical protein